MKPLFNRYKDTYQEHVQQSIAFVGQDADFFTQVKAQHLLDITAKYVGPVGQQSVLDVGCGVGLTDRFLLPQVKELHGVDVATDAIERAAQNNPLGQYRSYDGQVIPYEDDRFDVAFAICVMHHVPPALWSNLVQQMRRVLRPGGMVALYEHSPYNPLTRWAVSRCEFDKDAVLLSQRRIRKLLSQAGMRILAYSYILLVPRRGRLWRKLEHCLGRLPLGAQHVVLATKK